MLDLDLNSSRYLVLSEKKLSKLGYLHKKNLVL